MKLLILKSLYLSEVKCFNALLISRNEKKSIVKLIIMNESIVGYNFIKMAKSVHTASGAVQFFFFFC